MYICISTLKKLRAGEVVVLEKEHEFGEIAARELGGGIVGFALHSQPDGCVDFDCSIKNIGEKRILAKVVLSSASGCVLQSDSTALLPTVKSLRYA